MKPSFSWMKSGGNNITGLLTILSNNLYKLRRSFTIWMAFALLIVLLIATPILTIAVSILEGPGETMQHLSTTVLKDYIVNSVAIMVGTGLLSLLLGISTAWFVSTCQFPGKKIFEWALILPLAIPTYIIAITYAGIADFTGFFQTSLKAITGSYVSIDVMNIYGVIWIMSFVLYPYIYLIARASFTSQSRTILESGRMLGAGSYATFFKLALPVTRPAIIGGLTLVLMEVLNDYGAVKYFGVSTFTTGIFRAWLSLGDFNAAVYLSAILMLFILTLILLERYQRGQAKYDDGNATPKPLRPYQLKGWQKTVVFVICFTPLFFGFLLPLIQLFVWATSTFSSVINWQFLQLIINSFSLAVAASVICLLAATVLIYSVKLNQSLAMKTLARFSVLGYSIPGAVIAVGVMVPLLFLDKSLVPLLEDLTGSAYGLLLTGTSFALLFAYLVRFLAVAYNPIDAGFKKVGNSVDEASRSLGAGPFKTLTKIHLPLIKGALLSGALLVFVDVLKELPLTLILRPFNFNTLATKTFELAGDEMIAESAIPALIIIATGVVPIIILSNLISGGTKK
ncbi:iron ABC transporter permease [Cytophagaceae bacterium ABcell3]|nr:iron ABC transporter permease [Cytophagaceae bacterium ABcell3]